MIKKGYLKRIVVKQPNLNESDARLVHKHDFLVLNEEKVFLGRSSKECDLVLKPKIISRKHVVFNYDYDDMKWSIECLNDKNGVFVDGKLLKKNQVKKLEDNHIISFGPNFATDFIYQFTTKDKISSNAESLIDSFDLSYLESPPKQKTANLIDSSKELKMNQVINYVDEGILRSNDKKIRTLKSRVRHLEEKLNRFRIQLKESRLNSKKINKRLRLIKSNNIRLKQILKAVRLNLNKERLKKKELLKKLTDQERLPQQQSCAKKIKVESTENDKSEALASIIESKNNLEMIKKYKEIFSEDFTCGICLELFIEPVSATCGHSFCKFCINEWLKHNPTKRGECPMCRTSCKGYFKNVVIENIIGKYLTTADQEILGTRSRLIEEREKVIEASKNDPNNDINIRRARRFDLNNEMNDDPLIQVLNSRNFNFLVEDFSSNEDEDVMDYFDEENEDDDYSEDGDAHDYEPFNIVLE